MKKAGLKKQKAKKVLEAYMGIFLFFRKENKK